MTLRILCKIFLIVMGGSLFLSAARANPYEKAVKEEWECRWAAIQALRQMQTQAKDFSRPDVSLKDVQQFLDAQQEMARRFNEQIKAEGVKDKVSFSLRTNKLEQVFGLTRAFFSGGAGGENLRTLLNGDLPRGYIYATEQANIPRLGHNPDTVWGNAKASVLCMAYLAIEALRLSPSRVDMDRLVYEHPLLHWVHLSPDVYGSLKNIPGLDKWSCLNDNKLCVVGRYSFGGTRGAPREYLEQKRFPPHDCSSFVAKILNLYPDFSTVDPVLVEWRKRGEIPLSHEEQFKTWEKSPEGQEIIEQLAPIKDLRTLKQGDIYVHRDFFKDSDCVLSWGARGHIAIVASSATDDERTVETMGYTRNLPTVEEFQGGKIGEEGLGLQTFPVRDPITDLGDGYSRKVMFFDVRR